MRCWDQRPSDVILMEWGGSTSTSGYAISAGKLEIIAHFTNARSFSPFRQEEFAPGTWVPVFLLPTFMLMVLSLGFALTLAWTLPGSIHRTAMYQKWSGVLGGREGGAEEGCSCLCHWLYVMCAYTASGSVHTWRVARWWHHCRAQRGHQTGWFWHIWRSLR